MNTNLNKMKKLCLYVVVICIFFLGSFFITLLLNKVMGIIEPKAELLSSLLSGEIVGFVSVLVLILSLDDGNTAKKIENQLKLREMFNTPERVWIHQKLYLDPEKKIEELRKEFSEKFGINNNNYENETEFDVALYDYLGLFEVCYYMIEENQINKDKFFVSYSYRLDKVSENGMIQKLIEKEKDYWKVLKSLLVENDKWSKKHSK